MLIRLLTGEMKRTNSQQLVRSEVNTSSQGRNVSSLRNFSEGKEKLYFQGWPIVSRAQLLDCISYESLKWRRMYKEEMISDTFLRNHPKLFLMSRGSCITALRKKKNALIK